MLPATLRQTRLARHKRVVTSRFRLSFGGLKYFTLRLYLPSEWPTPGRSLPLEHLISSAFRTATVIKTSIIIG